MDTLIQLGGKTCSRLKFIFGVFLKLSVLPVPYTISALSAGSKSILPALSLCSSAWLLPSNSQLCLLLHCHFLCYWFPVPSLNIHLAFSSAKDVNSASNLLSLTSLESISMLVVLTNCFAELNKACVTQRPHWKGACKSRRTTPGDFIRLRSLCKDLVEVFSHL